MRTGHTVEEQIAEWRAKGLIVSESPAVAIPAITPPTATAPKRQPRKPSGNEVDTAAARRVLVEVDVPIRLKSEANIGGRTPAKIGRKVAVKKAVREAMTTTPPPLPVVVTITRHGSKELDDDNLRHSAKAVRDVVAEWLGLPSDKDRRVKWRVRQRPAWVPMVTIRVEHRGGESC